MYARVRVRRRPPTPHIEMKFPNTEPHKAAPLPSVRRCPAALCVLCLQHRASNTMSIASATRHAPHTPHKLAAAAAAADGAGLACATVHTAASAPPKITQSLSIIRFGRVHFCVCLKHCRYVLYALSHSASLAVCRRVFVCVAFA